MAYELMDRIIDCKTVLRNKALCAKALRRATIAARARPSLIVLASCRQRHAEPAQVYSLARKSDSIAIDRSARPTIEGTIARGQLEDDSLLYTGKVNGQEVDQFPFPITDKDLARGRERFNIYCSPCHSQLGDGNGMIVQRGFKKPPSYFDPRLMKAPVGHFFSVMTNGSWRNGRLLGTGSGR